MTNNSQKKKLINFRPIFYSFVCFALALYFAKPIFDGNLFYIILCGVIFISLFFVCLKFKCLKRFIIIFCSFIVGIGYYFGGLYTFLGKDYSGIVEIKGRVENISVYDGYGYATLENIKINGERESQNVRLYFEGDENFEVGDVLRFSAKIQTIDPYKDGEFASYNYKQNVAYECNILSNLEIVKGNKNLSEKVDDAVSSFTEQHFESDVSKLFKAVLLGDKSDLSEYITDSYSLSGIGHLLAVSGLHIGFIVSMLVFVLEKLKSKRWVNFCVLAIILFLYSYLCGFSSSVVRATIMSLVLLLARCIGKKYDKLNCFAIAGFVILLIKPLYIFDAGFLLSFGCVFCIFTLSRLLQNLFQKIKVPEKIASILGMTFSVQIGLLPIMSMFFESFSILSIFTNIVCVPLFQIAYILAFVALPICMLCPFLVFVLKFDEFLFHIITKISMFVSSIKWAEVSLKSFGGLIATFFYAGMFSSTGYIMVSKKYKWVIFLVCAVCLIIFACLPVF